MYAFIFYLKLPYLDNFAIKKRIINHPSWSG